VQGLRHQHRLQLARPESPIYRHHYIHYDVVVAKGQPVSIRLAEETALLVAEESRRSGRSRSAVVEELADEAAKARLFPGIAFRGRPRRAWVIGTGLDVWEVIELLQAYKGNIEKLRRHHELVTQRAVRIAQAYADRFPGEIEAFLSLQRRTLAELRALYPFLEF
jgi:hypothetical protein